jgi:hypothetical protein
MGLSASAGAVAGGGLFVESEDGASTKLTIGGELRTRLEVQQNFVDFDSKLQDHTEYVDARMRLKLGFELTSGVQVVVTPQTRYTWGGWSGNNSPWFGTIAAAVPTDDDDNLDLYEAYVKIGFELFGRQMEATVGRQEMAFGSELILGNDTKYAGLSWDGARLDIQVMDNLTTTLAIAKVVENDVFSFLGGRSLWNVNSGLVGLEGNNDSNAFLVWNTFEINEDALVDVYLQYLADNCEGSGNELYTLYGADAKIWTLGARLKFDKLALFGQNFDASVEGAVQFGDLNLGGTEMDISGAFAVEAEVGWAPSMAWSPRLGVGIAWASGDEDPTDDEYGRFNSMAQEVQGRLGKADMFVLENLQCIYVDVSFKPMDMEKLTAGISFLRFTASEEDDAQGVGGLPQLGFMGGNGEDEVCDEFDLYVGYKLNENVDVKFCWAYIEPGDLINETVGLGNSPSHRLHLNLVVDF